MKDIRLEPVDGLTCRMCGGRVFVKNGEPDYRMCECTLSDVWDFIMGKKKLSQKDTQK